MATVARVGSLVSAITSRDISKLPHVWLDGEYGLVIGTFGSPKERFDFDTENFVPIRFDKQGPSIDVITHGKKEKKNQKPRVSFLGEAKRKSRTYEIETTDRIYLVGSAKQLLVQGLNIIENQFPGTLEKLSIRKKRTKRPVARTRGDLYDAPHPPEHSERLKSGYFVATNNKADEAIGYLREAAEIAGLVWGSSFIVRRG